MTTLDGPIEGSVHTDIGGLTVDELPAGKARVKRVVYPPGWRWSTDMSPVTGTPWCQHAHVGFLAQGSMEVGYGDGCTVRYVAPAFVVLEPGHDGWTTSEEPAVLIQVDMGPDTVAHFGLPSEHTHT
jgi:hypothetical protein